MDVIRGGKSYDTRRHQPSNSDAFRTGHRYGRSDNENSFPPYYRHQERQFPRLSDRWDRLTEPYEYPTRRGGEFANAMSTIAQNPEEGDKRKGCFFENKFSEQIAQAMAIQMNLSTHQHANEKILGSLRKTGGVKCSLKEAVQARTAIYGSKVPTS